MNSRRTTQLFEFYLNLYKRSERSYSKIDLTGVLFYQDWLTNQPAYPSLNAAGDTITVAGIPYKTENTLISFFTED
jgi:iron complex outermembrane receptor protein